VKVGRIVLALVPEPTIIKKLTLVGTNKEHYEMEMRRQV
jgi:hypothetical protein